MAVPDFVWQISSNLWNENNVSYYFIFMFMSSNIKGHTLKLLQTQVSTWYKVALSWFIMVRDLLLLLTFFLSPWPPLSYTSPNRYYLSLLLSCYSLCRKCANVAFLFSKSECFYIWFFFFYSQQPFMKTQKSLILKKAVNSEPDILCMTSDPRKGRSVIAVCEVTFFIKKITQLHCRNTCRLSFSSPCQSVCLSCRQYLY